MHNHPIIRYTIEIDDMVALTENYVTSNRQFKRLFNFLKFLFPLIVGIYIIIDLLRHRLNIMLITTAVTISVVWVAFMPRFMMRSITKKIRRNLESGNDKEVLGDHQLTFSEEGFKVNKMDIEINTAWSDVLRVVQTAEYFFIYRSANSALVIPKHQLAEHRAYVTDFLEHKFPSIQSKK